jgi:hypothetical protein
MTHEEIRAIWMGAAKRHIPTHLAEVWGQRVDPNPSVEKFVAAARFAVQTPALDDPKTAPAYAAHLMVALLEPFQRLVETGKLDEVLPRLTGLPILYSPRSGIGASEWQHARQLYDLKRVGAECMQEHRGNDSGLARNSMWRHLSADTVRVIQQAAMKLPFFRELRARSEPCFKLSKRISRSARNKFDFEVFRLPGGELLAWPDWLDACETIPRGEADGLPVPVAEARGAYLAAARRVLDNFFADPDNTHGDVIVTAVTGVRKGIPRAQAVAEARKNVLDIIGRM